MHIYIYIYITFIYIHMHAIGFTRMSGIVSGFTTSYGCISVYLHNSIFICMYTGCPNLCAWRSFSSSLSWVLHIQVAIFGLASPTKLDAEQRMAIQWRKTIVKRWEFGWVFPNLPPKNMSIGSFGLLLLLFLCHGRLLVAPSLDMGSKSQKSQPWGYPLVSWNMTGQYTFYRCFFSGYKPSILGDYKMCSMFSQL